MQKHAGDTTAVLAPPEDNPQAPEQEPLPGIGRKISRNELAGERALRRQLTKMETRRAEIDAEIEAFKKRWNL